MLSRILYVPRKQARMVSIYTYMLSRCLLYQGNTRISRTEFVYAEDKRVLSRVLDRRCLLIFVLPAVRMMYRKYTFSN